MKKGLACMLAFALPLAMAQSPADSPGTTATSEIEQLKQMLLDQQKQINELKTRLGMAVNAGVPVNAHPAIGEVASTKPMVPPAPAAAPSFTPPPTTTTAAVPSQAPDDTSSSPLQFKLGDAFFTPVGFMDMTSVTRSTNTGSGIGTNFGSIPYGNAQAGALSETFLSPQNSRIGMRVDAMVKDMKVTGYWESDFLGQVGSPPNGGLAVSSNPFVFRLRLYWVDVRKGKFEILGGQSWSLMTPNRQGVSPLPSDVFYSQDMDVNYQLGLTWARNPGFRFAYHPTEKVAFAVALEDSQAYVGGANGGSAVVLPAAISTTATTGSTQGSVLGGQINNGSSVISASSLMPDIIAKLAFDPTKRFHAEIDGVMIANKIAYPMTGPTFPTNTKVGGGGSVNLGFDLAPGLRILTNNYYSNGGGRYIFGQAPDFIIRANGTASLVHSASTASGFEWTHNKSLFFGYYGGVYISRNMALDANGTTKIGYGTISSDGQNRAIQEITFGENYTIAKSPRWGALNLIFQYSYLQRNPWLVAAGAPTNANLSMGFFDLRYTLPGSAPTMGK
jgi:hypothetical protein